MPLAAPRVVILAAMSAAALNLVDVAASDSAVDPANVLSTTELLATGVSPFSRNLSCAQTSRSLRAGTHP